MTGCAAADSAPHFTQPRVQAVLRHIDFALNTELSAPGVLLPVDDALHVIEQRIAALRADIGPPEFLAYIFELVVAAARIKVVVIGSLTRFVEKTRQVLIEHIGLCQH